MLSGLQPATRGKLDVRGVVWDSCPGPRPEITIPRFVALALLFSLSWWRDENRETPPSAKKRKKSFFGGWPPTTCCYNKNLFLRKFCEIIFFIFWKYFAGWLPFLLSTGTVLEKTALTGLIQNLVVVFFRFLLSSVFSMFWVWPIFLQLWCGCQ